MSSTSLITGVGFGLADSGVCTGVCMATLGDDMDTVALVVVGCFVGKLSFTHSARNSIISSIDFFRTLVIAPYYKSSSEISFIM